MSVRTEECKQFAADDLALEIGARLKRRPSAHLIESAFQPELDSQMPLYDVLSRVDLVHILVLVEQKVIPVQPGTELLQALWSLAHYPDSFQPEATHGDLYTNREFWLTQQTASAAWFGAGRARREAITTAYSIKLRDGLIDLAESLVGMAKVMVQRSVTYKQALMPDYTYLQQAQPTSFGHYLSGFVQAFLRDQERLQQLYVRLNLSPAGCGSSNGSRIPQDRERQAALLGFDGIINHARDAMWQADIQIEIAALLTAILVNLDRLAEDLQIFASDEFGLIELDDSHARASKIMPQKKNPFALTHIRSLANTMIGTLTTTAAMGRTPSGQPDNRLVLYGLIPNALEQTQNAVILFEEVLALLQFNVSHARAKVDQRLLLAGDLAELLVMDCGVPFRDAHRLIGTLVHQYLPAGNFGQLTAADLDACAKKVLGRSIVLSESVLNAVLTPENALSCRQQAGGAGVQSLDKIFEQCAQALQHNNNWCRTSQSRLQASESLLQQSLKPYLKNIRES